MRTPIAAGAKVTEILQVAFAASALGQSFVWVKSPFVVMLVIFSGAVPVLVRLTFLGLLVVLIAWFPKDKFVGWSTAVCATPAGSVKTKQETTNRQVRARTESMALLLR